MNHRRLDVEQIGDVTVATLVDRKISDETDILLLGNELIALIEDEGRRKLIVDFVRVEYFSDIALNKLILVDKRMKTAKGHLRLCTLNPHLTETFAITRLNKVFDIRATRTEALVGM